MASDPLLQRSDAVDCHGRPASRSARGGWTSALFLIGVEITEQFSFYGISANLITYLTGPLGESTAAAAAAVNTWSGVACLLPLLGAFVADSYLGRYRTIIISSILSVLGLGMLTFSTVLPYLLPSKCGNAIKAIACQLPSSFQVPFFYISLYLVALGHGGHKPCLQAFGADQFDENDPKESISRSSFFNWWFFGMYAGITATYLTVSYIQDNIGWALGFGLPCIAVLFGLAVFLLGTRTYRFYLVEDESPFVRVAKIYLSLARRQQARVPDVSEEQRETLRLFRGSQNSALIKEEREGEDNMEDRVREALGLLRLFPIWACCLIYAVVWAQSSTFYTKQGSTLDRRLGSGLLVPPAALQSFIGATVIAVMPIYDRILVPAARKFSRMPTGLSMLQRIGIGLVLSLFSMVIAALVEMKRLRTARDFGLIDQPYATIPMSLWWLIPQYVLYGISEVFAMVGLQEFFYDQVPDALRSLGIALYLGIFGVGSFISSLLISLVDKTTSMSGESWFADNLNRAHLDYFYWLLAGLSAVQLVVYVYSARTYVYKRKGTCRII